MLVLAAAGVAFVAGFDAAFFVVVAFVLGATPFTFGAASAFVLLPAFTAAARLGGIVRGCERLLVCADDALGACGVDGKNVKEASRFCIVQRRGHE